MPDLRVIREHIVAYRPALTAAEERPRIEAAVALILGHGSEGGAELFFIERARRDDDPWSGQMAFPGGRRASADPDLATTAARETFEEVGIELADPLARLDDFVGTRNPRAQPLLVAPFVYELHERPRIATNHEVNDTVWIPLRWILHPDSAARYRRESSSFGEAFPAFRYRHFVVWGLTYRVLGNFLSVLGRDYPV